MPQHLPTPKRRCFEDFNFETVLVYLDDIIVSKTFEDHVEHLDQVLVKNTKNTRERHLEPMWVSTLYRVVELLVC